MLIERFKQPTNIAMDAILRERYTLKDASNHREPREYAQKILRSAKDAKLTDVRNQLDIIYNGLDPELRRDIRRPKDTTTLQEFLADLDDYKHDWWTYASRTRGGSGGNRDTQAAVNRTRGNDRPVNAGQHGQYNSSRQGGFQPSNQFNWNRQPPFYQSYQNRLNTYSDQYARPGYQGYQGYQGFQVPQAQ